MELIGKNKDATIKLAQYLGHRAKPGDILVLVGDLGAGKTTFTKEFGKALGYLGIITSPTFTLINEYIGPIPLYHFDTYRLENVEDVDELGFDDYFYGSGVCVIEWGERIEEYLPENRLRLEIQIVEGEQRKFILKGEGSRGKEWMEGVDQLENTWN
ncbi:MAG: tRNA (adenosine(37)-N6)-threonylcarbamoyltransferase complex ATPase subunit type 1 TsaE [Tissierellia bacterium]|nr:tRNA (adenosine(37)-N6)-threonylcarbamoyltransferase complex ATPase subunit type 1 TsaE [Tissierellia bacterium]